MRRVKYIFVILGGIVVSINAFASEKNNEPDNFFTKILDTSLLKSEENDTWVDDFTELVNLYPKIANFVIQFWHKKAYMHYRQEIDYTIGLFIKAQRGKTEKEKEEITNQMNQNIRMIYIIYYYDHWEEIKEMIHKRLKVAKNNTDRIVGKKVSKPTGFIEKLKLFIGLDSKN